MIEKFFRKNLENLKAYKVSENNCSIRLDANESFLNLRDELLEDITKELKKFEFNRYPDSTGEEVRKLYGEYSGVNKENLIFGNGSDELIQIISTTFLNEKDKIVTLEPDFSMYKIYAQICGANIVTFQLGDEFKLNVDKFIEDANKEEPKIIIFSNPNNPIGGCIKRDQVLKIIKNCKCIVVVDEAYFDFSNETVIDEINTYENLIVLRTCSKALGMASMRMGFLAANEKIINEIYKVKSPYNVNSLTQVIGKVVLKRKENIKKWIDSILDEREFLIKNLKEIENIKVYPSYTNFVLIEVLDSKELLNRLSKNNISVRGYEGGRLKNHLRITVGTREENIKVLNILRG